MFSKKKSFDYFNGFHQFSNFAVDAAVFLDEIIKNFDRDNLAEQQIAMHEIENNCDMHKHAIDAELFKEFLPPIAAEDIVDLNHKLDNVVDAIEDILIRIYAFNVKKIRPQALAFSDIIVKSAFALQEATEEFKDYKNSKALISKLKRIKQLELDADQIYISETHRLHVEAIDVKELIVWSRIYDGFEECADSFEEVSKKMEAIIIKNT